MTPLWKHALSRLRGSYDPTTQSMRKRMPSFPSTYPLEASGFEPRIFDPSLRHFSNAFRLKEPVIDSDKDQALWKQTRRAVIDHVLQVTASTPYRDNLVLRGSLLLQAWLGDAARDPGDIDWVFQPPSVGINDDTAFELFETILWALTEAPHIGDIVIDTDQAAVEDIWTYERAAGRRVLLPWDAPGLPRGYVQMDIVFSEEIFDAPIEVQIPTGDVTFVPVHAASKELSLAWKIMWLESDSYPQGKDLYDAVLLAERTYLPPALIKRVFDSVEWTWEPKLNPESILDWDVDWNNFRNEYPWVRGDVKDWKERLIEALAPTFTEDK